MGVYKVIKWIKSYIKEVNEVNKINKEKDMQKETAKKEQSFVRNEFTSINSTWGPVIVSGAELVSAKTIEVLEKCLNLPEFSESEEYHGVKMVIFKTSSIGFEGEPVMATSTPDGGLIVISLTNTIAQAVKDVINTPTLSIVGMFHLNMVLNMLHEIHHMSLTWKTGVPKSKILLKELEELAEEWSKDKVLELVQTNNIEPGVPSATLTKCLLNIVDVKSEGKITEVQKELISNNIMFQRKTRKGEISLMSFKKMVGLLFEQDMESDEWKAEPITITETKTTDTTGLCLAIKTNGEKCTNKAKESGYCGIHAKKTIDTPPLPQQTTTTTEEPSTEAEAEAMEASMEAYREETIIDTPPTQQTTTSWTPPGGTIAQQETPTAPPVTSTTTSPNKNTKALIHSVYNKIYNHIFSACQPVNGTDGFLNPEGVSQAIQLTAEEQTIVTEVDCLAQNGKWCPRVSTNAGLRGLISKDIKLPMYKLYIKIENIEYCRILMPQNPNKVSAKTGQLTYSAIQAQNGAKIMYVMQGDRTIKDGNFFIAKCENGKWKAC